MKLPRDSPLNRFYFSYPSFFFFYTHFSLQDLRKKTRVPLNVFNISKKKKIKIAKNLDNLKEVSLGGDIFEI